MAQVSETDFNMKLAVKGMHLCLVLGVWDIMERYSHAHEIPGEQCPFNMSAMTIIAESATRSLVLSFTILFLSRACSAGEKRSGALRD